jgi:hypothetical protein
MEVFMKKIVFIVVLFLITVILFFVILSSLVRCEDKDVFQIKSFNQNSSLNWYRPLIGDIVYTAKHNFVWETDKRYTHRLKYVTGIGYETSALDNGLIGATAGIIYIPSKKWNCNVGMELKQEAGASIYGGGIYYW